jgi:hypothetical protein
MSNAAKTSGFNGFRYAVFRDILTFLAVPLLAVIFGLLWQHESRLGRVEMQCIELPTPEVKQALLRIDQRLDRIDLRLDVMQGRGASDG